MEEKILQVLENTRNNALTLEEIFKKIGYSNDLYQEFLEIFEELRNQKKVYCTNSSKGLFTLNPYREGILHERRNKTYYAVLNDGREINIDKPLGAMDKDKVLVKITDLNSNEGTIKEIIERHGIIAEVKTIASKRYAVVGDNRYQIDLEPNIVDGMLIGIKLNKTKEGKFYKAQLDKVIGHKNAPKVAEKKLFYEFDVPYEFSPEALEEAKNMPTSVGEEDIMGRKDLRGEIIFTIDGDDTKDIDDALSYKILPNGNHLLKVHIADVTHYVKENSHLDLEARERGNSYYTPGVVNPMYPPELSNGICSLNPDVDRLALTCEMEIDKNGKIINYDIYESVIHSRIQMTYKNVNKILDEQIVQEGYEPYKINLNEMNNLAKLLKTARTKRGKLDLNRPDIKILTDERGKPTDITKRYQGTGECLIEEFMLIANECVATHMFNLSIPFLYRVDGLPSDTRLKQTLNVIKTYGENISTKVNLKDPRVLQKILKELDQTENSEIYATMILRCLDKARYDIDNIGHYAIGVVALMHEAYTHFTSPIRRYSDTTVHRIIKKLLQGKIEEITSKEFESLLKTIAQKCSEMERVAEKIEREANKMKMAGYINEHKNETHKGRITGFTKSGMFVELENLVEGRVGYNTMDDYYTYDEELEVLVGRNSKRVYRLGDKVEIKVVHADEETREIDFELTRKRKKR